jgi:DNA polymerase-3 subunit chi
MATLVTFYALSIDDSSQSAVDSKGDHQSNDEITKAANLAVECVKSRKKTTVLCDTQAQAEAFDELVWQYPADQFVPHNLFGEGPDMGTPVEIIWIDAFKTMRKLRNRAVVINLSQTFIEQYADINQIIDFVPHEETLKINARERYKQYKQAGCQLEYKNA